MSLLRYSGTALFHGPGLLYDSPGAIDRVIFTTIDCLALQQKSMDRVLYLYISMHEAVENGIRAPITIVHI